MQPKLSRSKNKSHTNTHTDTHTLSLTYNTCMHFWKKATGALSYSQPVVVRTNIIRFTWHLQIVDIYIIAVKTQQSWRSPQQCWALVGCFAFTLQSNSSQTRHHLLTFSASHKDIKSQPKISNLDTSDHSSDFHWFHVHSLCFLAHALLLVLLFFLSSGFFKAI